MRAGAGVPGRCCAWSASLVLLQFNRFTIVLGAASLAADRDLSVHQALHLLAAAHAGPDLQVGRAGRLGGRHRLAGARRRSCSTPAACCGPSATTRSTRTRTRRTTWLVGLKSTALRFGDATPRWLVGFYAGALRAVGLRRHARRRAGSVFFLALAVAAVQLAWQVATLDIVGCRQLPGPLPVQSAGRLGAFPRDSWPTWRSARSVRRTIEAAACASDRADKQPCDAPASCRARRMDTCQLLSSRLVRGLVRAKLPQKASDPLKRESK